MMTKKKKIDCSKCGRPHVICGYRYAGIRSSIRVIEDSLKTGRISRVGSIIASMVEDWERLQAPIYADLTLLFGDDGQ